jgi:transcriptional regulator with XRE-family HTH domain
MWIYLGSASEGEHTWRCLVGRRETARVREARREAGLSLAQLAGDEVSRTFLHFVEHGRSRPAQAVLALIAKRTGRPVAISWRRRPRLSRQQIWQPT